VIPLLRSTPRGRTAATIVFALLTLPTPGLWAQATATASKEEGGVSAAATTNDSGPAGIVPFTPGFNASLGTSSQHDSSNGWSSLITPNVAYRLNRYFSADVGAPIYLYISVYQNIGTTLKPVYTYVPHKGVVGDTALNVHAEASPLDLDYNAAFSLGLPSGNTTYGLGAGQVTYNVNNHVEKSLGMFKPDIEVGIGDTNSLVNERVRKSYVSVGALAHFQAGTSVDLPMHMSFEADAYEELPLTTDLVYSTTGRGRNKKTTSTNNGPAEDNGFLTTLDIPLVPHVTLSGFYNRSLRQHDDVGGFSLTFLLKAPPKTVEAIH
jgi:hypothetical protein